MTTINPQYISQDETLSLVAAVYSEHNSINRTTPSAVIDILNGTIGNDSLIGDGGNNTIFGLSGNDTINGLGGDDYIYPGSDLAIIDGGSGLDTVDYGEINSTNPSVDVNILSGSLKVYSVYYPPGPIQFGSISNIEIFRGGSGNDTITGGNFADTLLGGYGNDLIEGGAGNDYLSGGLNFYQYNPDHVSLFDADVVSYEHATGAVTVNLSLSGAQNVGGGQGVDTITGFMNLLGSAYGDNLNGDSFDNVIYGLSGNDIINGGAGDDVFDGGAGDDFIDGGSGRDTVYYMDATSSITVSLGFSGPQSIGGGMGVDTLRNIEIVYGSNYTDTFTEVSGDWVVDAGLGNDLIISLSEKCFFIMSLGDDTITRTGCADGYMQGSGGFDVVDYSLATQSIQVNTLDPSSDDISTVEKIVASGFSDTIYIHSGGKSGNYISPDGSKIDWGEFYSAYGGAGNDTIVAKVGDKTYLRGDDGDDFVLGGYGFDDINGNKGNDTAAGGAGADWVVGGQSNDLLYGGAAAVGDTTDNSTDIVYGNLGNDTCYGGAGGDTIRGGQGDDLVFGENGNDWLSGDRGNDTLTGGAGADIFHSFSGAGIDRVLDFNLAQGDRVQLDPGTSYTVSQVGADTVINMGNGDQMILVGVTATSLTGSWIFIA